MSTTARLVYTEVDTAAELRRRAVSLERCASTDRFYGLEKAANRQQAIAQSFRAMAALVESAPFASEYVGPGCLAQQAADSFWRAR